MVFCEERGLNSTITRDFGKETITLETNIRTCMSHSTIGLKNSTFAEEPFQLAASCPVLEASFQVSEASYPSEASFRTLLVAFPLEASYQVWAASYPVWAASCQAFLEAFPEAFLEAFLEASYQA